MHAVLLLLLWGFIFPFQFFAITLVLEWYVFLQLCVSSVSSVEHLLFKIVPLGRRASVIF
jgi:hypothetical protein